MKPTQPLVARLTVRKTVHFVSTLEVYEVSTTPKPVIETTGETTEELPPSVPSLRSAKPVQLRVVRKSA
jgi:hypothetical protein